ncbi:biosynthetic peptidoglycan transglycosylase [Pseudomonas duriflava]|uniref:biosynthetic peptidoglycan transglycosylase n=1 Tax=Pseudomonas duriflava TaxID=459528 RepID=UPI003CC7C5E3
MWQRTIQRASYRTCTIPIYCGIAIVKLLNYKPIFSDLEKCAEVVNHLQGEHKAEITGSLIHTLVVAEDHRNSLHFGVDPIAILRSIKVRILQGKRQGASTIEQQFVRTITARYEKTPRRKVREQILAVMLSSRFSKDDIASCYLKVAYYGVSLVGIKGVRVLRADSRESANEIIVAHLKYPRSSNPEGMMAKKHSIRVTHIKMLLAR